MRLERHLATLEEHSLLTAVPMDSVLYFKSGLWTWACLLGSGTLGFLGDVPI